ncbi:hypothetical protein TSAR_011989 [Trichomalopsis sarcophagae]|uniref:Uncharacterized protein n=1 Tax=Trichomalopsis sarcophagae TaxID=543379 RepID=A0A232F059_9HYME|nr:hypothetical protein TSAR_011989 [Trichomalopsis sarcophagae]
MSNVIVDRFSPSQQPSRPSSSAIASRPHLQKRPHSKPNNSPDQDYHDHQQQHHSSQNTRRPQNGIGSSYLEKRPEEDRHHSSHSHHHHHHHGFKDKTSNSHNTLLVRLPNKNSNGQQGQSSKNQNQRPHHPRPGYGPRPSYQDSRPEEDGKTDEQAQDLTVQETVHRPSINSVDDNLSTIDFTSRTSKCIVSNHQQLRLQGASEKLNNPNINLIHTERPQWATKPASLHGRPTALEYSKPYFSVKTTPTSTTSTTTTTTTTQRPSHLAGHSSKPTTTTVSTSYYSGQSTSHYTENRKSGQA